MTIDAVIAELNAIDDRAELVAFLTPLRLPTNLDGPERARVTAALITAASRCWRRSGKSEWRATPQQGGKPCAI